MSTTTDPGFRWPTVWEHASPNVDWTFDCRERRPANVHTDEAKAAMADLGPIAVQKARHLLARASRSPRRSPAIQRQHRHRGCAAAQLPWINNDRERRRLVQRGGCAVMAGGQGQSAQCVAGRSTVDAR